MSGILKEKQRSALWEIVAMGQNPGMGLRPSRLERKAAKAAYRVLEEHKATPNKKQRQEAARAAMQRLEGRDRG